MMISATILAAGASSRMEVGNKLLLNVDGVSMIAKVCDSVLQAGFDPVILVTGKDYENIEKHIAGKDVRIARNEDWESGMASSIHAGLSAVPEDAAGNMIVLGDMPAVSAETMKKLKAEFENTGGNRIVYPEFEGRQGNPVIFPRKHFEEILSSTGDRGCKKVLKKYPEDSVAVAIDSDEVVLDCDTDADYLALTGKREHVSA